jgi:hypothetical protein
MKTIGTKFLAIAATGLMAVSLNSCKKEVPVEPKKNTTTVSQGVNVAMVNSVYNETMLIVEALYNKNSTFKDNDVADVLASCAVITYDSSSFPYRATLDFGLSCEGQDGKMRSGVITVEYNTQKLKNAGTFIHATLTNFTINNRQYNGTINITNNGVNGSGNLEYAIDINATFQNTSNGDEISTTSSCTYEFTGGKDTPTKDDDVFTVNGTIAGTDAGGTSFTTDILTPLQMSRRDGCSLYYIAGEVRIQSAGNPDKYIDYGNGDCDDLATETVNGNSQTIQISSAF